ncbi:MAG: copper-translocating P-type ATPase [Clostridium sp. 28_12]|nr:MAG: copper-translocating P-type ATPase [Clostridium sp. 28_12]
MKKVLLKIDGMTCSACSSGLEKFLNKQDGIATASVNLIMNNASIEYDDSKLTLEQVEKFVDKAGFTSLGIDNLEKEEKKKSNEKYKLIGISVISILILYISMSHMVGLPVIPFLNMMTHPINYAISLFILTIIVLWMGRDILKNGYKNLIHKTPNMDTLVMIGVFASFIYSVYGTIRICNGNEMYVESLYYESAAIVIFFIKIGKYVESKNKDKTKEALQQLMSITPNHATIIRNGKEEIVTLDEIQKGDIVICKPGEKIAVDGEVVEGTTHINESFITGESVPVKREKGSKVIAGSINYEGTIKYKAEKIGKESTVSEIVRLVVEATNTKAPIAKVADTISGYFVPTIIAIAMIAFIIWFLITKNVAIAINILVTILVVACPCSLGLATPLAIVIASGNASKKGILVKTSEALENAHKVKTICFDKTGTLTKGELTISKIYNYSSLPENEILKLVASIENKSEHPIARAIVNEAKSLKIELEEIADFKAIPGYGVSATIKEKRYLIGNKKLMVENNVAISQEQDELELVSEGNSILFVAENQNLIALIGVKDVLKDESIDIVKKLQKRNIEVVMLTGDNEKTANAIAKQIGVDKVIANVLPKQKAEEIKKLKQKGLVMMCGDGINDSVSIVTADIGVSVSSGTDIAMDSSNVVLMNDNLEKIEDLLSISQKTIRNIKQNLFWAFFYNICMIPIACGVLEPLGIVMNPMIAAFAMTISSLTVILNALRLKRMDNY